MMKEVIQQTPEDPRVCKFGSQIKQKQKVWEGFSTYDFKDKKTDRFDIKHNTY